MNVCGCIWIALNWICNLSSTVLLKELQFVEVDSDLGKLCWGMWPSTALLAAWIFGGEGEDKQGGRIEHHPGCENTFSAVSAWNGSRGWRTLVGRRCGKDLMSCTWWSLPTQHTSLVLLSLKWHFVLMQGAGVTLVKAGSSADRQQQPG